jgi:hypothetical protein
MLEPFCRLIFLMMVGHAIADRPLQDPVMRAEKNSPRVPGNRKWIFGLACHGLIHGGAVAVVTGLWWLGVIETAVHAGIDDAKCRGRIGLITDQALHLICKILWAIVAVWIAQP